MPPQIEIVFRALFEDLRSMKQQQGIITNYGVAILAAIYAMRHQLPGVQTCLKYLVWVTAVAGSALLLWVQCNVAGTRRRLDEVHNNFFTSNELRAVGLDDKAITKLLRKLQYKSRWRRTLAYGWRGLEFTVPLILVLLGGAILVCLSLQSVKP
jgi:hypothetical protein